MEHGPSTKRCFWMISPAIPSEKNLVILQFARIIIQRVTCLSDPEVRSCGAVEAGMAHATTGADGQIHGKTDGKIYGKIWVTECYRWFSHQNLYQNLHRNRGFRIAVFQTIHLILQKNSLHMRRQTWTHAPPFNHLFLNVMYIVFFRKPTPGVWLVLSEGTRSDVDRHLRFETWPMGPMWPPFLLGCDANFKNLHDWFKKKTSHMI